MEPIGFTISVVALASLFNSCLEDFEKIKLARAFGRDLETYVLRLENLRRRLSRWGELLGLKEQDKSAAPSIEGSPSDIEHAKRNLGQIRFLITEAEQLIVKYKLHPTTSGDTSEDVSPNDKRSSDGSGDTSLEDHMRDVSLSNQESVSFWRKSRWALTGKNELEGYLDKISTLINDLLELFPATRPLKHTNSLSWYSAINPNAIMPRSTVPFSRDSGFVENVDVLDRIQKECSMPGGKVALCGLGGTGKTQFAIEYAYRTREMSSRTWVFWINASNRTRFEESSRVIAETLGIPGCDNAPDVSRLVSNWLRTRVRERWLLIVDNADDFDAFFETKEDTDNKGQERLTSKRLNISRILSTESNKVSADQHLERYIPTSENGSVLITSRNEEVAFKLTGNHKHIIEIGPMTESSALKLLNNRLRRPCEEDTGRELVKLLDCIPLATSQAAAYINEQGAKGSASEYLDILKKADTESMSLLFQEYFDPRRYSDASSSPLTTWKISFEQLRAERPTAAKLLSLLSFCDREAIPEYLFTKENKAGEEEMYYDSSEFERDLKDLQSYALVYWNSGFMSTHRLVQLATHAWLQDQNEYETCQYAVLRLLMKVYPETEQIENAESDKLCEELYPHVQTATSGSSPTWYKTCPDEIFHIFKSLLWRVARQAQVKGNFLRSQPVIEKAYTACLEREGPDHINTIRFRRQHAVGLKYAGRGDEPVRILLDIMDKIKDRTEFSEKEKYAIKLDYGVALLMNWELEKTIQVLTELHESIEPNPEEYLETYMNVIYETGHYYHMVATDAKDKRYDTAASHFRQHIELCKKHFKADDHRILGGYYALACTLFVQDKYAESESMLRDTIELLMQRLGELHLRVAAAEGKLGQLLDDIDKHKEAEPWLVKSLDKMKLLTGERSRATLEVRFFKTLNSAYMSKYAEAEQEAKEAVDIEEEVLGSDHVLTVIMKLLLGVIKLRTGHLTEGSVLVDDSMSALNDFFGHDDPRLKSIRRYANLNHGLRKSIFGLKKIFRHADKAQKKESPKHDLFRSWSHHANS